VENPSSTTFLLGEEFAGTDEPARLGKLAQKLNAVSLK